MKQRISTVSGSSAFSGFSRILGSTANLVIMLSNEIVVSKKLLIGAALVLLAVLAIGAFAGGLGKSSGGVPGSSGSSSVPPSGPGAPSPPAANLTAQNGTSTGPAVSPPARSTPQDIYIRAKADGTYDKSSITVTRGVPVRLHFTADSNAGCGRQLVLYGLNVKAVSIGGVEQVVEFTPTTAGTYEYNCGMKMWQRGSLIVQ